MKKIIKVLTFLILLVVCTGCDINELTADEKWWDRIWTKEFNNYNCIMEGENVTYYVTREDDFYFTNIITKDGDYYDSMIDYTNYRFMFEPLRSYFYYYDAENDLYIGTKDDYRVELRLDSENRPIYVNFVNTEYWKGLETTYVSYDIKKNKTVVKQNARFFYNCLTDEYYYERPTIFNHTLYLTEYIDGKKCNFPSLYSDTLKNIKKVIVLDNYSLDNIKFANMPNLKSIDCSKSNKYAEYNNVIYTKDKKKLIYYPSYMGDSSYTVFPETEEICRQAFSNTSLTKLTLNNNIKKITPDLIANSFELILGNGLTDYQCFVDAYVNIKCINYNDLKYIGSIDNPYFLCICSTGQTTMNDIHPDTKVLINVSLETSERDIYLNSNIEYMYNFRVTGGPALNTLHLSKNVKHVDFKIARFNNIEIDSENPNLQIKNNSLYEGNKLVYCFSKDEHYIVPENTAELQHWAFYWSTIKNITLPNSLIYIHDSCFGNSKLEKFISNEGLLEFGDSVFRGCSNLKEVYFSDTVSKFDSWVSDNIILEKLHLGSSIDPRDYWISLHAKEITVSDNSDFNVHNNIVTTKDNLTLIKCTQTTGTFIIPENIKYIGREAFSPEMDAIYIPKTINSFEYICDGNKTFVYYEDSAEKFADSFGNIIYASRNRDRNIFNTPYDGHQTCNLHYNVNDIVEVINEPFITKQNYIINSGKVFVGWYDNPELTGNMLNIPFISNHTDIYAKWLNVNECENYYDGSSVEQPIIIRPFEEYTIHLSPGTHFIKLTYYDDVTYYLDYYFIGQLIMEDGIASSYGNQISRIIHTYHDVNGYDHIEAITANSDLTIKILLDDPYK